MKNLLPFICSLLLIGAISCKEHNETSTGNKGSGELPVITNEDVSPQPDTLKWKDVRMDVQDPVVSVPDSSSEMKNSENQGDVYPSKEEKKKVGEITFEEKVYDFGRLPYGDIVTRQFKFSNTGEAPLNIKSVTASCGCTIASYPFISIAPGDKGVIEVEFNSKGKMGWQMQSVTVISDGNPLKTSLALKGLVVPQEEEDSSSQ